MCILYSHFKMGATLSHVDVDEFCPECMEDVFLWPWQTVILSGKRRQCSQHREPVQFMSYTISKSSCSREKDSACHDFN